MLTASILGTQIKCHQKLPDPPKPTSHHHVPSTLNSETFLGNWSISWLLRAVLNAQTSPRIQTKPRTYQC